jgi:hypothetical protein
MRFLGLLLRIIGVWCFDKTAFNDFLAFQTVSINHQTLKIQLGCGSAVIGSAAALPLFNRASPGEVDQCCC